MSDLPSPQKRKKMDIAQELAGLKHDKQNQGMKNLPSGMKVQRRPLAHAAIASPHAGPHIPKVVYISRRTPLMSAVKRVKKLLQHIEKRSLQSHGIDGKHAVLQDHAKFVAELADASEKIARAREEVLVKASGRAMEQALRVGEWFRTKEKEIMCHVEIRTSSVAAIDDIVENSDDNNDTDESEDELPHFQETAKEEQDTTLEGGDTTMEILGDRTTTTASTVTVTGGAEDKSTISTADSKQEENGKQASGKRRRKKKRKRLVYEKDDVPEARIRWVKTVEVGISLKG